MWRKPSRNGGWGRVEASLQEVLMRISILAFLTMMAAFGAAEAAQAKTYVYVDNGHHSRHHDRGWRHGPQSRFYYGSPFWNYGAFYRPARPVVVTHYYHYTIAPAPAPVSVPAASDRYCREYYGPANVGGKVVQTYGNACLQPDGSWQIVD